MADRRNTETSGAAPTLPRSRQRVELVYRWKVRQDALDSFHNRVIATIERLMTHPVEAPHDVMAARICQPILGPGGDIWEVHLEFESLQAAGRVLDAYERTLENSPLWDLSDVGPVAEVIESSAPLYRTAVFSRGGDDEPTAEAEQQEEAEAQAAPVKDSSPL